MAQCKQSGFSNLTFGKSYQVLDQGNNKVKIIDDNGQCVWMADHLFQ